MKGQHMRSAGKGVLLVGLIVPFILAWSVSARAQFETRGRFIAESNSRPWAIAVGDFNHDGKLDLAVVSGCCPSSGVTILLERGDGTFAPGAYYAAGDQPVSIVAADFDHDGNLDLAVANSLSPYLTILLGNGDGTFRPGPQNPPLSVWPIFVTVGDFNGDGKPDLAALGSNVISILLGNGDGTFQNAVITAPTFAVYTIGAGDFNHDGKLDLAAAGTFGFGSGVNILLGNGDGTFQYGANYPGETAPATIAVADFNGDHNLDLAIAHSESNDISVLLGNGDGTFQPAVDYPTPFPDWLTLADVNGDHKLDLVAANFTEPSGVSIFLGNGDGTFRPGVYYPGGNETSYVAAGDFNGDRKTDIVGADFRYNDVYVMLNTGVVSFSPTTMLNFTKQAVGTTSPPQTVTLTNTGSAALRIASMKASAEFGVTSTCGASVAAGAKCTISVTFSPTKQGKQQGTITIIDSASTKPQVIDLFGTGT